MQADIEEIHPAADMIKKWASHLELEFVQEADYGGNVCMSNSAEVRDEYRLFFTLEDFMNYVCAVLYSDCLFNSHTEALIEDLTQIPLPENPARFWKNVQLGRELRKSAP